jgi:hypothetical protein
MTMGGKRRVAAVRRSWMVELHNEGNQRFVRYLTKQDALAAAQLVNEHNHLYLLRCEPVREPEIQSLDDFCRFFYLGVHAPKHGPFSTE